MIRHAPRDLEAVRLIALHRFLTHPQLEELLFAGEPLTPRSRQVLAWRVLRRLQRDGYVAATPRHVGGSSGGSSLPAYFLTRSGLAAAALTCPDLPANRPARRAAFLAPHSVMTTEIELAFRRAAAGASDHDVEVWEADWQIAMRLGDRAVKPDARIAYRAGGTRYHMFIETDLGSEGTRFFARKMRWYIELYENGTWREFVRVWPRILTVTLTDVRAASLRRATQAMLDSRYAWSRPLCAYFVSLDALRSSGLSALCHAVDAKELVPLVDLAEIVAKQAATAAATNARNVESTLGGLGSFASEPPEREEQCDPFQANHTSTWGSS